MNINEVVKPFLCFYSYDTVGFEEFSHQQGFM